MSRYNKVFTDKTISVMALVLASALAATSAFSASDRESQLVDRISAIGDVCIEGEDCGGAAPAVAAAGGSSEPRSAKSIYDTACFACHTTGVAGAPKIGDAAGWETRVAAGLDTMVANAIKGINAMPPMGTCMDCSDDDIRNVVQYMVDASQ